MTRSMISTLAFSALVASGISSGAAQAQTTGGPTVTEPTVMVPAPAAAPATIAPSMLYGAGPPTDGLDSNPYRKARQMHKMPAAGDMPPQSASTAGARTHQPARGGAKPGGPSTLN